jgi:uncharacterized membrane protein
MQERATNWPLVRTGIVLGIGLGGFFDGIVLHQILQWHHMLTSAGYPPTNVPNLEINTFWDGIFHASTYVITVVGVAMLWRLRQQALGQWSGKELIGAMLVGWGLFNLVEGIIDHHILGIHHVRPGPSQLAWDLAFLAWGAAMLLGGWGLIHRGHQQTTAPLPPRSQGQRTTP